MSRIPRSTTPATSRPPTARSASHTRTNKAPTKRLCDPQRALEHYLIWHEAEGHSRKTELVYRKTLRTFFAYLKDEQHIDDLGDLTLEHLRAWLVWLRNTPGPRDRPRSSKTIESYCRQVKALLHWLYVEELLDHNPAERLKLPKAEKKHLRVFTDEEIKRLHEVCAPPPNGLGAEVRRMLTARNRAVLWMLLDTGMRAEELCRIRFADLDQQAGGAVRGVVWSSPSCPGGSEAPPNQFVTSASAVFQDGLCRGIAIGCTVGVDDHVLRAARLGLSLERCPRRRIGEIWSERASRTHAQDMGAWPSDCLCHKRVLPFTSCSLHVRL